MMRVVMEMKVVIIKLTTFCQFYCDHLSTTTMIMIKQPWINYDKLASKYNFDHQQLMKNRWSFLSGFYWFFTARSRIWYPAFALHSKCDSQSLVSSGNFPVHGNSGAEFLSARKGSRKKIGASQIFTA